MTKLRFHVEHEVDRWQFVGEVEHGVAHQDMVVEVKDIVAHDEISLSEALDQLMHALFPENFVASAACAVGHAD